MAPNAQYGTSHHDLPNPHVTVPDTSGLHSHDGPTTAGADP